MSLNCRRKCVVYLFMSLLDMVCLVMHKIITIFLACYIFYQVVFGRGSVQSQKILGSTPVLISSLPSSVCTSSTWSVSEGNHLDTQHKLEMGLFLFLFLFFAGGGLLLREGLLNINMLTPSCPNATFLFKHNLMSWWLRLKWAFKLHDCVLSFFLYFCLASFFSEISISWSNPVPNSSVLSSNSFLAFLCLKTFVVRSVASMACHLLFLLPWD